MKFISISDVHHMAGQNKTKELLELFCNFGLRNSVQKVLFLGDIFDFLVGKSKANAKLLEELRSLTTPLLEAGTELHYFAGNHDFHLKEIFHEIFVEAFGESRAFYHKKAFTMNIDGKNFYISHGDNEELDNFNYKIFKTIINNPIMEKFSELNASSPIVDSIGNYMLKKSIAKPSRYDTKNVQIRDKFRRTADSIHMDHRSDIIILGHSHVSDLYVNEKFTYVNNGFVPSTRSFVFYNDGELKLNHFDP